MMYTQWSFAKKCFVSFDISFITFSIYIGSYVAFVSNHCYADSLPAPSTRQGLCSSLRTSAFPVLWLPLGKWMSLIELAEHR
jgi:hypothetical protein